MAILPSKTGRWLVALTLLLLLALKTGDWLARQHHWWVFDPLAETAKAGAEIPDDLYDSESSSPELPAGINDTKAGLARTAQNEAANEIARPPSIAPIPQPSQRSLPELPAVSQQSGEVAPISVIHSRQIVRTENNKPVRADLERLRQALQIFGESLDHEVVILDADEQTLVGNSLVLYHIPELDVTGKIREIYIKLGAELATGSPTVQTE